MLMLMSAVETGQMSAAEAGQMSAVETRQMSSVARADICLVAAHNVDVSSGRMSQCSSLRSLNFGKVTMCKSQIGGLALNRRKWPEMGPEWSPGPENRSPGFPRPFPSLWDQSRGPNPPPGSKNGLFGVSRWGHHHSTGRNSAHGSDVSKLMRRLQCQPVDA